jgi:hypothetical protein
LALVLSKNVRITNTVKKQTMSRSSSTLRVLFVLILILVQEPLLFCAYISPFAGDYYLGDGGAPTNGYLFNPMHAAVDSVNNLVYIADKANYIVRVVNRTSNTISTVAGIHSYTGSSGDGKHELLTQLTTIRWSC